LPPNEWTSRRKKEWALEDIFGFASYTKTVYNTSHGHGRENGFGLVDWNLAKGEGGNAAVPFLGEGIMIIGISVAPSLPIPALPPSWPTASRNGGENTQRAMGHQK
jgi:hypothetical protein